MAKSVLITGASSGIGRALALEYAAPGVILGLIGRNKDRLDAAADLARAKGASVSTATIDVRDADAMSAFLLAFDGAAPVDCVVASAGVTSVARQESEPADLRRAKEIFDVNVGGVMNTLAPLAPRMRRRRAGQIAILSSLAAFAPVPNAAAYSASKAALLSFSLALRALYRADGVSVSAICPGFVDTPMTSLYKGRKPGLITAEEAARRIRRGLERRKAIVAFPLSLYFGARAQEWLPLALRDRIMLAFR